MTHDFTNSADFLDSLARLDNRHVTVRIWFSVFCHQLIRKFAHPSMKEQINIPGLVHDLGVVDSRPANVTESKLLVDVTLAYLRFPEHERLNMSVEKFILLVFNADKLSIASVTMLLRSDGVWLQGYLLGQRTAVRLAW